MTYRVYLGFTGNEAVLGHSAVSIDWEPGTEKYLVKIYDEIGAVPHETELALLQKCLALKGESKEAQGLKVVGANTEANRIRIGIYRECAAILSKAWGALHVTRIQEETSVRNSVAFNYYKVAYTSNADIQSQSSIFLARCSSPGGNLCTELSRPVHCSLAVPQE